jgi:AcrR family transcriptional regulator
MSDRTVHRPPTRQKLLDAAARIFARDGLNGATTRAIAREAGVNEVTLFRHFHSKERLLAAVVGANFGAAAGGGPAPINATDDLRADLLEHARQYDRLLTENLPLVRTMIGEIHHHHRAQERQVYQGIFRPLRVALTQRLETARAARLLRADVRPDQLADLFGGMIFSGVLRRSSPHVCAEYSAPSYLTAAVDLVVNGATVRKSRG